MDNYYINFEEFLSKHQDEYVFDAYRKQEVLEEECAYALVSDAKIEEVIQLPDNDFLIAFSEKDIDLISYYKLSEIDLVRKTEEIESDETNS